MKINDPTRRPVRLVHRTLRRVGFDMQRFRVHPYRPRTLPDEPATILDVGAADGTPELYDAFPRARIIAFDPIKEQLDRLSGLVGERPIELCEVALGRERAALELFIDTSNIFKSTLHDRSALTRSDTTPVGRVVQVETLDSLVAANKWAPPFALKIDTEGHELDVLLGASSTLEQTAVVYCETSVAQRFEGGYGFRDVASLLIERGFDLVDVTAAPQGTDGRTAFLDCVWQPKHRDASAPGDAAR